jgi:hypothetical protein
MCQKRGSTAIVAQWHDHFDSVPPPPKHVSPCRMYVSEEHGTVFDSQKMGRTRTARSEKNKELFCQPVLQSPRKSTCRLALRQEVSRQSVHLEIT